MTQVGFSGGSLGTAIQAASSRNSIDIVRLLLENNADVNISGEKSYDSEYEYQSAKLLFPGGEYGTALQAAASNGWLNIVKLLLGNNADPNIVGEHVPQS
jgi:ankyrin repeat protein